MAKKKDDSRVVSVILGRDAEMEGNAIYVEFGNKRRGYNILSLEERDVSGLLETDVIPAKAYSKEGFGAPVRIGELTGYQTEFVKKADSVMGVYKQKDVCLHPMRFISEIVRMNNGMLDFSELITEGVPAYRQMCKVRKIMEKNE